MIENYGRANALVGTATVVPTHQAVSVDSTGDHVGEQDVRQVLVPREGKDSTLEEALKDRTEELERERTELATALAELKRAQIQLVHSQKLEAIGSLAAGIAHEINTPAQFANDNTTFLKRSFSKILKALDGYRQLLRDLENEGAFAERAKVELRQLESVRLDFLLAEIPGALEGAAEGLSRISSIVRAMKDFSHPSNGLHQPTDLASVITTAATVARNEWKYVAEMETRFDPDLPEVPCLRDELGQVLVNLIVNAAHAVAANTNDGDRGKGRIVIGTKKQGEYAEISVADNGCGIPPDIQHRVFEPFFTTKPVGTGTGQGLAITYSVVVDKHHGQISLESEPGLGTTFRLLLPLRMTSQLPPALAEGGVP